MPPGYPFSVMDYGAHADGVTADDTHIASAAAAAVAAGGHVYFPPGTYLMPRKGFYYGPTLTAGAYYYAPVGVKWVHNEHIIPASGCTIDGVTFQREDGGKCISDGTSPAAVTSDVTIKNCTFSRVAAGEYSTSIIVIFRGRRWTIESCTMTSPTDTGGNIQVLGGDYHTIRDNTITGGTTGVLFMFSRSANGGAYDATIHDCLITGNTISGYSQEGISFDLKASSAGDIGLFEYDTAVSVSGQDLTLSAVSFPDYTGYEVFFITGALAGRARAIVSQSGTGDKVFTLSGNCAGMAGGDTVSIGSPYRHNTVSWNTITSTEDADPYSAVLLYGLCYGNIVENNTVPVGKIKVQSLDHTAVSSISAVGANGRAPCGYNTVRNNTITDGHGKVFLEYYALGGAATPFTSYGNNVYDNDIPKLEVLRQNYHASGNTGTLVDDGYSSPASRAYTYDFGGLSAYHKKATQRKGVGYVTFNQ